MTGSAFPKRSFLISLTVYKCDSARRESGSGLGLAIVRELAHAIGGEITAQSVPEGSTTFCLTLPLSVRKN